MPCSFIDPISQKVTFTRNKSRQISSFVSPAIEPTPMAAGFVSSELCFSGTGFSSTKMDGDWIV